MKIRMPTLRIGMRLAMGFGVVASLAGVILAVSILRLQALDHEIERIAHEAIPRSELMHAIIQKTDEISQQALRALIAPDDSARGQEVQNINAGKKQLGEHLQRLDEAFAGEAEEGKAIQQGLQTANADYLVAMVKYSRILAAGKVEMATEQLAGSLEPKRRALFDALTRYKMHEQKKFETTVANTRASYERGVRILLTLGALSAIFAAAFTIWLSRSVSRPLQSAARLATLIADGKLDNAIPPARGDEAGDMLRAIASMQTALRLRVEADRRTTEEIARIKISLDGAAMPMTIADERHQIIYMNNAARSLWAEMAGALAARRKDFSVEGMMGQSVADLFEDERVHQAWSRPLAQGLTLDIQAAGKFLRVTETPVLRPGDAAYIGRATQWVDRTAEVLAEREIAGVVGAASDGDLSQRVATEHKTGFMLNLTNGMNALLATNQQAMQDVVRLFGALARGDLSARISAEYQGTFGQMKHDANHSMAQLAALVATIRDSASTIDVASDEIAKGNSDLSGRTEAQAANIEETASSMEELTATVKQNSDNARQASEQAAGASGVAVRGGEVFRQVVATMIGISASSKRIADITSTIDGIAFQTNILALNAAVEAARAGTHGRGFAVVASEVRNLAKRSAEAAKEIRQLTADSAGQINVGAGLVNQAGATMDEILKSIRHVTAITADITSASAEQSSGIEQVNQAVMQMDNVTQQNAALVEQAAAATKSLHEQASVLLQAISQFRLDASDGTALLPARKPRPGQGRVVQAIDTGRVALRASTVVKRAVPSFA